MGRASADGQSRRRRWSLQEKQTIWLMYRQRNLYTVNSGSPTRSVGSERLIPVLWHTVLNTSIKEWANTVDVVRPLQMLIWGIYQRRYFIRAPVTLMASARNAKQQPGRTHIRAVFFVCWALSWPKNIIYWQGTQLYYCRVVYPTWPGSGE